MPYQIHFLSEKLILQVVTGRYSELEMKAVSREMAAYLDKHGQSAYVLVDFSKMEAVESHVVKVRNAVQPLLSHPKLSQIVVYGTENTVVHFLGGFLKNLFKLPIKILGTQEEAISYLLSQAPEFDGMLQDSLQKLREENIS